ncbi:sterol desaturase family protein [uncultured Marinobacter sp.]|uniref:sterol desaturase family protein n=1 Tax=uncultured Marinobacter sp. TaxID=187379 RepID=UPI00261FEC3A|nr:sterol desaturase family protein [uncultured Marinobacter sp.]
MDDAKLIIFLLGFALLYGVETLFSARPWKEARGKRLRTHLSMAIFNTVLLKLIILAPFLYWTEWVVEQGWGLAPMLGYSGLGGILATIIVLDMLDYWWHRFNHRLGLLWRFHKVHHVDTHVDITTALRFHPGELFISFFVKLTWIALWGPSLAGFIAFEIAVSLASQFHHSNIDLPERWERRLRKFIVTPRFHASHHTVARRTGDANFATIFIVWDRLFGTYAEPDEQEMTHLGLPEGRDDYLSFSTWLTEPFRPRNQAPENPP